MKGRFYRRSIYKVVVITAIASGVTMFSLSGSRRQALASAFGPTQSHTGAVDEANCTACHADFDVNSGEGSIEITGLSPTYTPGQQFNITVKASQADAVIYGFQLTAIDSTGQKIGTFTIPDASENRIQILQGAVGPTNLLREYVEHKSGGLSNGQFGFNSWTFQWTAPSQAAGRIDFYAAGNCANSDGGPGGDYIYTTSTSTVPASSLLSISGRVFTASGAALRNTTVTLSDANGNRRTATTSSFGNYSFANVAAGVQYTLTVQSKRYRFAPRSGTLSTNLTNADFTGLE